MKHTLNILLLILTLISANGIACTCSIPKSLKAIQDYEFENSECIFIGEILKIDTENNTFEIKVIESFNGDENGKIYNGIYDIFCGPIIDKIGKWLIYANYNSDNIIEINECGITRSFLTPEHNLSATRPPKPLPQNKKETKLQAEKKIAEWKLRAKYDLENEIADLRKRIK